MRSVGSDSIVPLLISPGRNPEKRTKANLTAMEQGVLRQPKRRMAFMATIEFSRLKDAGNFL